MALILISLIAFPFVNPFVICFWISCFVVTRKRNKFSWMFLLTLVCVQACKGPELNWSWIVLMIGCVVVAEFYRRFPLIAGRNADSPKGERSKLTTQDSAKHAWLSIGLVALALVYGFCFWTGAQKKASVAMAENPIVVCLGDSLTSFGYPKVLQNKALQNGTDWQVLDYGQEGITSADGLERLTEILQQKPQALVLELGGHDYNQGRARNETWNDLDQIIKRCKQADCEVIIVEIPRGFVFDPFFAMERGLARKHDLHLIPDTTIRKFVFFSPLVPPGIWLDTKQHYSRDGLHPNDRGNQLLADEVLKALEIVFQ